MYPYKIGVINESFRLPVYECVKKAKEVGAEGIQVNVTNGDLSVKSINKKKSEEFKMFCAEESLEITAL